MQTVNKLFKLTLLTGSVLIASSAFADNTPPQCPNVGAMHAQHIEGIVKIGKISYLGGTIFTDQTTRKWAIIVKVPGKNLHRALINANAALHNSIGQPIANPYKHNTWMCKYQVNAPKHPKANAMVKIIAVTGEHASELAQ